MKITSITLFACFILSQNLVKAQNINQHSAWAAFIYSQKISPKTGLHFDFQLRSADEVAYVRNILIRPGFTYFIDDTKNATLGYALILTNQPGENNNLAESRIWEQFIYNQKIGKIPIAHRFRLEQRFIDQNIGNHLFSQRLRYFFRSVIPLEKQKSEVFSNGLFVSLQNEVFLNLQNKDKINNNYFDQNRAYTSLGYRLSKKADVELGYLNQYIKGRQANNTPDPCCFSCE